MISFGMQVRQVSEKSFPGAVGNQFAGGIPATGGRPLAELDGTLDRSHLMPAAARDVAHM